MSSLTCVGTTDVPPPVKKQYRQNELGGQEEITTGVEVCVMGDPEHVQGPQTTHHLSKITQTG